MEYNTALNTNKKELHVFAGCIKILILAIQIYDFMKVYACMNYFMMKTPFQKQLELC